MKFRLLERNYWADDDYWTGRKLKYKAEISTPFRKSKKGFGKYSFSIKTPYGSVHNTNKTSLYFDTLENAIDYVENWIIEDHNKVNS